VPERVELEHPDEAASPARLELGAKPVVCSTAVEYPAAAALLADPEADQRAAAGYPADEERWAPLALVQYSGLSAPGCAPESAYQAPQQEKEPQGPQGGSEAALAASLRDAQVLAFQVAPV